MSKVTTIQKLKSCGDKILMSDVYEKPVCMGALTKEELNAGLEKGYADILAGRTKPIDEAIADMRKDFDL